MLRFLTGLFCFLLFSLPGFSQILSPLASYPIHTSGHAGAGRLARTQAEGDTIKLPFFDDFSAYTGTPSLLYWKKGGGAYANNQFGVNPPSIGVATFDGVNGAGDSYSNFTSYGYTDTLTSKPIQLKGLNAGNNVYLSFYVQAGGLGGAPNTDAQSEPSFLALEFKAGNQTWTEVWRQAGENKTTAFTQVMVRVENPIHFHEGFQFRFRSSGVRKGNDDTWNIDYVYLDRNRDPTQPNRPDVALSQRLTPLLERYTAMPAKQFFLRPAAELNDSATTRLNNFNNLFAPITWRGYVKVLNPAAAADTFLRGNAAIPPQARNFLITGKPNASAIGNTSNTLQIKHSLFLKTRETDPRLRQNDTVSRVTELADYYAYDDGTAETNFSLNNSGNRQLAYRFDLNEDDHVRAIRVYLTKTNVAGHVITFRVWDANGNLPAETSKASKSFVIPAVATLNQFFEIPLPAPVPVSASFYIGFSLPNAVPDFVNIGYDLNDRAPGRIFFNNNSTGWLGFHDVPGALLLRPVMGTVTGIEDDLVSGVNAIRVFPNPSAGLLRIEGPYASLLLTDLAGRVLLTRTQKETGTRLDLRALPKGLYLLRFTQANQTQTKKIILTR